MEAFRKIKGLEVAVCDQCIYGQTAINDGVSLPAKKGTTFMTHCHGVAEQLRKRCEPGLHTHAKLDNWVAASTEAYPDSLVRAFLEGLSIQIRNDALRRKHVKEAAPAITNRSPDIFAIAERWIFDTGCGKDLISED